MSPANRKSIWLEFCARYGVDNDVPLFRSCGLVVETAPLGRAKLPVLARSEAMESMMLREVGKVLEDFKTGHDRYEGLIYCMYERQKGAPAPLYIGKTEKFGKKDGNLSANLAGIKTGTQHPFARWGYNYAYHLGDLSAVVLEHPNTGRHRRYQRWAQELFHQPFSERRLKRPVYLWAYAWERGSLGPWQEPGSAELTFLEYQLIGLCNAEFPALLNQEGVNR